VSIKASTPSTPSLIEVSPLGGFPVAKEVSAYLDRLAGDAERESEKAWVQCLDNLQFQVLRLKGTEAAHTGAYLDHYASAGVYSCSGCGASLYEATHKVRTWTPPSLSAVPSHASPLSGTRSPRPFWCTHATQLARCAPPLAVQYEVRLALVF
jgi:hypothetical protein